MGTLLNWLVFPLPVLVRQALPRLLGCPFVAFRFEPSVRFDLLPALRGRDQIHQDFYKAQQQALSYLLKKETCSFQGRFGHLREARSFQGHVEALLAESQVGKVMGTSLGRALAAGGHPSYGSPVSALRAGSAHISLMQGYKIQEQQSQKPKLSNLC